MYFILKNAYVLHWSKGRNVIDFFSTTAHTYERFYHRILFAEFFKNFHKSELSSLPLSPHFIFDVFPTFF